MSEYKHPGGKLRELGAHSLTDEELLAILISTGIKGKSAEEIAAEVLQRLTGVPNARADYEVLPFWRLCFPFLL